MANFKTILYLDDMRVPSIFGVDLVRNYDEFVAFLTDHEMPELISFDHDLAFEHYPLAENRPGVQIPYGTYKEKTGLECARYIIDNKLPLKHWISHSMNVQGNINIATELRAYCPQGEVHGRVPYRVPQS
jgi:hypothetical protein